MSNKPNVITLAINSEGIGRMYGLYFDIEALIKKELTKKIKDTEEFKKLKKDKK